MFSGGKKRVRELEDALAKAEKEAQEANARANEATERAKRAESDLLSVKEAAASDLLAATSKENARADQWEAEYNNIRAQYEADAKAWDERFTSMGNAEAERASSQEAMAQELDSLKAQLQEFEATEAARGGLEQSLVDLQQELAFSKDRVLELEKAAKKAAEEKEKAVKAATEAALKRSGLAEANAAKGQRMSETTSRGRRAKSVSSPLRDDLDSSPSGLLEAGSPASPSRRRSLSPQSAPPVDSRLISSVTEPAMISPPARSPVPSPPPPSLIPGSPSPPPPLPQDQPQLRESKLPSSPPVLESKSLPTLAEVMSPKRSKLKVDTSDEARGLRTEVAVLRAKLEDREKEVTNLQTKLEEKLQELVTQGEKSYQLYEKLEKLTSREDKSRDELTAIRTLLLQEIAGEGVEVDRFANVSVQDLIRLSRAQHSHLGQSSGGDDESDEMGGSQFYVQDGDGAAPPNGADRGLKEDMKDDDRRAERAAAAASANSDMISRLQIELQVLRQNNKRLTAKIDSIESIERTGQAAIESMDTLKRRTDDLVRRLRLEKDLRGKTNGELDKANERIQALSKHIEKVMIHLKHEAAAKNIALTEVKNYKKEATVLRQRNASLQRKAKSRDRVTQELKEGTRILEDQLRLMDEKYVQLRTKLDWTRATSNRETKRIQQEANKLRASFALAFSQVGSLDGSSLNLSMLGGTKMSGGNNPDSEDNEDADSDDSDDEVKSHDESDDGDVSGEDNDEEAKKEGQTSREEEDAGIVSSKAGSKSKKEAKFPDIEIAPRGASSGNGGDVLPAIESILPSTAKEIQNSADSVSQRNPFAATSQ
ncbi:Hypothetical Protein FCC1311_088582 [Hondaea fermentalgiana]|uniref:Uncharacterized protein n=1 Tax=Hondaea fermentalgiana TaxID=2315210 RepID=A0A2R5GVF5_9STRA|nr:Hypothetical Protein FCC1311_088582 [Hondaea fermentalgiana]|eukprot:GBG32633.1 Hypothetical Protein FCC1311_088582 [Hondaea fermentalgiana]